MAGARHSDVLDRTARLENKVEQQGVKAELKAIEAEGRSHKKAMALLRLRNKGLRLLRKRLRRKDDLLAIGCY